MSRPELEVTTNASAHVNGRFDAPPEPSGLDVVARAEQPFPRSPHLIRQVFAPVKLSELTDISRLERIDVRPVLGRLKLGGLRDEQRLHLLEIVRQLMRGQGMVPIYLLRAAARAGSRLSRIMGDHVRRRPPLETIQQDGKLRRCQRSA